MPESAPDPVRIEPPDPSSRGGQALWVRSVLRLQQTVGNREVLRLLALTPPEVHDAAPLPVVEAVPMPVAPTPATWRQRMLAAMRRRRPGEAAEATVVILKDER